MSKRTKYVFGSHSELAHVWANESQESGKAGSLFFENTTDIFSYGRHYKAARIFTKKGKKFALVNSFRYSSSTGKHLAVIRDALNGLMPYFETSDVNDPVRAVKEADVRAYESIQSRLKRVKVTSTDDITWALRDIILAFNKANKLRKLLGRKPIKPNPKDMTKVKKHLKARLKRYYELNTPEMLAEKLAIKEREVAKRQQLEVEKQIADIVKFRNGERVYLRNLEYDLLRIIGKEVETTRNAIVPLKEAKTLLRAIQEGKGQELINRGTKIGNFGLTGIYELPPNEYAAKADMVIEIGCHRILLSEAENVLGDAIYP